MIIKNIKILDENFETQEHMNIVTNGPFITYVGKADSGIALNGDIDLIDGNNKFLMPAFYNTHCHVPMTLLRGYGEGLPLQRWLNERIFPFEAKFDKQSKYWGAKLGALELMKSGCISISDMYFDLVDYTEALYESGLKANVCNGIVCFDENDSYYDNNAYRDTERLIEWIKDHDDGRVVADVSIHSEYASREKAVREAIEYSQAKKMIIQVHVSETKSEHEECIKRHGMTPVKYFEKCGMFKGDVIAAHCVWLDSDDMDTIVRNNAVVSHNISSNLKLGSGIAPIAKYYEKGMRITVGTDGASSNNNLNFLEELHLVATTCRGISHNANAIAAKDILKMATRDGALAQGRDNCGLIKEGYKADFIIFDLDKEHLIPDYDTVANIVFAAQSSDICMTVSDGKIICRDGQSTLADEEEVRAKARESFEKVLKSL